MSEKFRRIKKQEFILSVLESLLFALSAALFFVGAVMLILGLCGAYIHFGWYILIGACPAAAVGAITFFATRPTDAGVAAQLDRYFSLRERIGTMVEYEGKEGEIIGIQRADAVERLDAAPRKKISLKRLLALILVPVVAIALFVSALFVYDGSGGTEREGFSFNNSQRSAIRQLITDVNGSALDDSPKQGIVVVLESLSETLESVEFFSDMQSAVITAVLIVDATIIQTVTFDEIADGLEEDSYLLSLGSALRKGISVYKDDDVVLNTLESVTNRRTLLDNTDGISQAYESYLQAVADSFTVSERGSQSDLASYTSYYTSGVLSVLLAKAESVWNTDALCLSLVSLCTNLQVASGYADSTYSDETVEGEFTSAITEFDSALASALREQVYACMMDEFVRNRLSEIFGVTLPDSGIDTSVKEEESSSDGGSSEDSSGAASGDSGGKQYGSNDKIYDPESQSYAEYGPLLDSYYQAIYELKLEDEDLSEELIQFINSYFNYLLRGLS